MAKDMRKIVEKGYDDGNYLEKYRLDDKIDEYPFEKKNLDKLTKLLKKGAKILDLGSGPGIPYDKYLVNQGFDVTGIDISKKHIDIARKNVPKARYIKGDFSKVDFEKESFHAIVSFYAIFHVPRDEHRNLFIRINELLKKDGIILVTLGTSDSEYGEEEKFCGASMAWSSYDPDTAKEIIRESGFDILEATFEGEPGDDEYHLWVLAQKI